MEKETKPPKKEQLIHSAEFVSSYTHAAACPKDGKPEFAFIGRSNVGKSSLINMLSGVKGMAKVSGTPGKTRLLNYFLVDAKWYLVDLPGYGYARLSHKQRFELAKMIEGYVAKRQELVLLFVLIDLNVPPQAADIEFVNNLGELDVPFALVYTKTDRMKPGALVRSKEEFEAELLKTWNELPQTFITSSKYAQGREDIIKYIQQTIKQL